MIAGARPRLPAAEAWNMRLIGHDDLGDRGDCMQVCVLDGFAYIGHQGTSDAGTSVVDVSDPTAPRLVHRIPRLTGTMTHKVQARGDILIVNHQRNRYEAPPPGGWSAGLAIYDISRRAQPRSIGFFATPGAGVHRMAYWSPPYAYVSATAAGYSGRILLVLDLSDPARPAEAGRWWLPGQHSAGGEEPTWGPGATSSGESFEREVRLHHVLPRDDRAYGGWGDAGLVILDVADKARPRLVSHLDLGPDSRATHTALPIPGREMLVVTDEQMGPGKQRSVYVVDIADETQPRVIARLPRPAAAPAHPGVRFGPHNLHEMAPGSFVDPNTVYLTYFAGGLRVYDISKPFTPTEIAFLIPEAPAGQQAIQFNDLFISEDGVIFCTDRVSGGLYIMEHQR